MNAQELGQVTPGHIFKYEVKITPFLAGLDNRYQIGVTQAAD